MQFLRFVIFNLHKENVVPTGHHNPWNVDNYHVSIILDLLTSENINMVVCPSDMKWSATNRITWSVLKESSALCKIFNLNYHLGLTKCDRKITTLQFR